MSRRGSGSRLPPPMPGSSFDSDSEDPPTPKYHITDLSDTPPPPTFHLHSPPVASPKGKDKTGLKKKMKQLTLQRKRTVDLSLLQGTGTDSVSFLYETLKTQTNTEALSDKEMLSKLHLQFPSKVPPKKVVNEEEQPSSPRSSQQLSAEPHETKESSSPTVAPSSAAIKRSERLSARVSRYRKRSAASANDHFRTSSSSESSDRSTLSMPTGTSTSLSTTSSQKSPRDKQRTKPLPDWPTLSSLVDQMIEGGPDMRNVFLLTMHYFTHPQTVLTLLLTQLKRPPPTPIAAAPRSTDGHRSSFSSPTEAKSWDAQKLRIFSIIKHWVKTYPEDFDHRLMSQPLLDTLNRYPPTEWERMDIQTSKLRKVAEAVVSSYDHIQEKRRLGREQAMASKKSEDTCHSPKGFSSGTKNHWVPDEAAKACMMCWTSFTLTNRRHHCRNCGLLVCGDCSTNTAVLDIHHGDEEEENNIGFMTWVLGKKNRPVRVCDTCHERLTAATDIIADVGGCIVDAPSVRDPYAPPALECQSSGSGKDLRSANAIDRSDSSNSLLSNRQKLDADRIKSLQELHVKRENEEADVKSVPRLGPVIARNLYEKGGPDLLQLSAQNIAHQLILIAKKRVLEIRGARDFMKDATKWLEKLIAIEGKHTKAVKPELNRLTTVQNSLSVALDKTAESLRPEAKTKDKISNFKITSNQRQWQMRMSNQMSHWVCTEILCCANARQRQKMFELWIKVANICFEMNNFNTLFEIMTGLSHNSVYRLDFLFESLPRGLSATYERLCKVVHYGKNYRNYREHLERAHKHGKDVIPYMGVMLRDVVAIEELGSFVEKPPFSTSENVLVNFSKCKQIYEIVLNTLTCQHAKYDQLQENTTLQFMLLAGIIQACEEDELTELSAQIKPRNYG